MRGKRGRPKARSPDPNRRSRVSPHVRSSSSNSPGTALGMFSRLLLLTFKEDRTAERCASRASSHCTPPLPLLSLCAPCMQSAERRHCATLSRALRCIKQGAKCYIKQGAKWSGHRVYRDASVLCDASLCARSWPLAPCVHALSLKSSMRICVADPSAWVSVCTCAHAWVCVRGALRPRHITNKHTYIHTYIHAYIHTYYILHKYYIHTYMHAYIHTYIHAYIHTYVHTYVRTYVHTYIHTYMHACIHATYIHTYMHTYIHTYVHTYIHTYIHTYSLTYIQSYIHTVLHTYIHACMHAYIHRCMHIYMHAYTHTYIHTYKYYTHGRKMAWR